MTRDKAKRRAYQRKYYRKHKAELLAYQRKYHQEHRAERRAKARKYYRAHLLEFGGRHANPSQPDGKAIIY